MEARILSYEKGDLDRSVALQNIARKLKEENENLLLENRILKQTISGLQGEQSEIVRPDIQTDLPASIQAGPILPEANNVAVRTRSSDHDSLGSSRPTCHGIPSPSQSYTISYQHSYDLDESRVINSSFRHYQRLPSAVHTETGDIKYPPSDFVPASHAHVDTLPQALHTTADAATKLGHGRTTEIEQEDPRSSVLSNLPAYHPPIPLPWSGSALSKSRSVFPVSESPLRPRPATTAISSANCSGDPANCAACVDDAFGRAFCRAVNDSADSMEPCIDYPNQMDEELGSGVSDEDRLWCPVPYLDEPVPSSRTIPTNEAWSRLKAHPNVDFSDLALLADVVVRRSQRAGSYQEHGMESSAPHSGWHSDNIGRRLDHRETERRSNEDDIAKVIPLNEVVEDERRRVREVRTDAVEAALLLLDAKYGRA